MVRSPVRQIVVPAVFILLTVFACGTTLVSGTDVLASKDTDLTLQFLAWRQFGFTELAHGNLALWNPHIFAGAPYFAGFQSALLYPPNWLHLILPLARAINLLIALHVFAAGYFTYLWCRRRTSLGASILAGMMFMFGGPYFLHIYAGHLPHVCAIVWIPLILMAIDGIVETGRTTWVLLGAIAIAMQILAGNPQYVYYTGIVATVYAIASIVLRPSPLPSPRVLGEGVARFAAMYALAILLSAIQLFPGIAVVGETVRSNGLSYGMASTFALPPENFLTLLAPNIFGALRPDNAVADATRYYFGRAYLWEASLFVSVTGVAIAIYGAITMSDKRLRWVLVGALLVCIVLALGRHTPLYWLMYRIVPKYGSFRGTVKFLAPAVAFASMLAAIGFDRLLEARQSRRFVIALLGFALAIAMVALTIKYTSVWATLLSRIASAGTFRDDNELFVDLKIWAYSHPGFIKLTAHAAAIRLLGASLVLITAAGIVLASMRYRWIVFALPVLSAIELMIFVHVARASAPALLELPQAWRDQLARSPNDARFLILQTDPLINLQPDPLINAPMYFGFNGVWGYDPGVLKRYAELMTFSQGVDPSTANQYINFVRPSDNIFRMIRAKALLQRPPFPPVIEFHPPMPVVSLIRNYAIMSNRDEIFRAIESQQFDPRSSVILESAPPHIPQKGSSIGQVEVVSSSTDTLEIRPYVETPAILLITNNFAEGWRARPLQPGPQTNYVIQPANWTQQAIALTAGKHRLLLEYSPLSFRIGQWVSMLSVAGLVASAIVVRRKSAATE